MIPSKTISAVRKSRRQNGSGGFALITVLVLMVLLVVLALGLLSLATISLRAGKQESSASIARANARLALQLAIGMLQTEAGVDQRITAPADQLIGTDASTSAAVPSRRHWTGVYRSWLDTETNRPSPVFLTWLVSGNPSQIVSKDFPTKAAEGGEFIQMVGTGTVGGLQAGDVKAPLLSCKGAGLSQGRCAWWVGDQGTKAAMATPVPDEPSDLAANRATLQSSPRNAAEVATTGNGGIPFADMLTKNLSPSVITGWKQAELLASTPDSPKPLFHDLAAHSVGLVTNVRSGGFRKDLSLYLEKPAVKAPTAALYQVDGVNGINESELWVYYNLWRELKTGATMAYTTGGSIDSGTPYLQVEGLRADMLADPEYLYKQPAIINFQTILSFHTRQVKVGAVMMNRLAVVVDPIVTMWNPLDVPVAVSPAFNSIKFCQLPYDISIKRPSGVTTVSLCKILGGSDTGWQYLTLVVGKTAPVVMKPGEVLMFSQGAKTAISSVTAGLNFIDAVPGWNFGGGIALDVKSYDGKFFETASDETFTYELKPNSITSYGTKDWSLTGNGVYYKGVSGTESFDIGGMSIDQLLGKPLTRITAAQFPEFFDKIKSSDTRPLTFGQLAGRKEAFLRFAFVAKTENNSDRPGRFLTRFNPKALTTDFQTLTPDEFETLPFEVQIEAITDFRKIAVNEIGQTYFGGGTTFQYGSNIITTHSIPREPLNSLAAFQNSFANGLTPLSSPANLPLMPQIDHAIGNSSACSVIPADKTSSSLDGPRPLADHSFLVNQALWDAWFLSSVAPQTSVNHSKKREQEQVARDFLGQSKSLPNNRYQTSLRGETVDAVMAKLFKDSAPAANAHQLIASYLVADGMFNVNSTSIEAWKCLFSGLKDKPVVTRNQASGKESLDSTAGIPVASQTSPQNQIAQSGGLGDVLTSPQWAGRRVLNDKEITELATAIVREVRKRGPFTSLADFVNRRPGSDLSLARAGAIQSALDSKEVSINGAYNTGPRSANTTGSKRGFAFPEAEEGPAAYGIPGVVKQADILTPIAPYLSARSDTFLIRTYGDCLDASGKVVARAWCEAEVQRQPGFVDPSAAPETDLASLTFPNTRFGRRFEIVSFRWLTNKEI